MPLRSSVGWLGCSRVLIRPGNPMVLRNRVVTAHCFATAIKSWLRMILETAAVISGVSPQRTPTISASEVASFSSHSRKPPTVSDEIGANAVWSWDSAINRLTSSSSGGSKGSDRNSVNGKSASTHWATARSSSETAAIPANSSADRSGDALANKVLRFLKW